MTILITMAGFGSRFQTAGYAAPKYAIAVKGKTLFQWSMESLNNIRGAMDFVFVVRAESNARDFIVGECAKLGIAKPQIMELDKPTNGQATTAFLSLALCNPQEPLLIYNIDTYVEPSYLGLPPIDADGYIPCFTAPGSHWSFVRLDEQSKAVEVREKERISDFATIGLYGFRTPDMFRRAYETRYVKNNLIEQKEAYIAPMYNDLIAEGLNVRISTIPFERVHALGTPAELEVFRNA